MENPGLSWRGNNTGIVYSYPPPIKTKPQEEGFLSANTVATWFLRRLATVLPCSGNKTSTSNTHQYHPVSNLLSLCFTGKALPETITRLWPQHTAPAHSSFRFDMPNCPELAAPFLQTSRILIIAFWSTRCPSLQCPQTHLNTSPYLKDNQKILQDDCSVHLLFFDSSQSIQTKKTA